jgi:hypothetical protein
MSFETQSETDPESAGYRHIGLRAQWSERTINLVAVCTGVLVVALIAVLMEMA